jgi:hypothetical protein
MLAMASDVCVWLTIAQRGSEAPIPGIGEEEKRERAKIS